MTKPAPESIIPVMLSMETDKATRKTMDKTFAENRGRLEEALRAAKEDRFEYDDGKDDILVGKRFKAADKLIYDLKAVQGLLPKRVLRSIVTINLDVTKLESLVETGVITAEELSECVKETKPGSWTVMVARQKRGE